MKFPSSSNKKAFCSKLRQSRAACRNGLLTQIEETNEHNDRLFYTLVKGKRSNTGVQQLNFGDNCYSGQDIIHGWTRYFCDLSTPDYTVEEACKPTHPGDENYQGLEHLFTSRELHTAISALKPAKASGPDNISAEHLMYIGNSTRILILILLN